MKRAIDNLAREQYDLLVIGGGINGAAIAHMAVLNGLKTALIEKGDFASGTSSKSTKLIHGGLRYLENLEFGLVRESLKERSIQLNSAPHLVRPLKFIIPVYKSDKRPLWLVKWGVRLYDYLSGKYVIERHRTLTAEGVCHLVPDISREGLIGGVMYSDAQMNDARLCLENVLSADEKGADVANYCEARTLIQENGKTVGANVRNTLTNESFAVRAKGVVCAVGPWTNEFMKKESGHSPKQVRTTKGAHIIYKGRVSHHAILVPSVQDRRIFFIIPWQQNSLIGTTDTDYSGAADDVTVKQEDIDYLIREAARVLPDGDFSAENIITTFAGLRPLVRSQGSPERMSRRHAIKKSYSGIKYVFGGKYTTYRKIAEDVISDLAKKPLVNTQERFPVYGSGVVHEKAETLAPKYGLEPKTVQYVMDTYGVKYKDVLSLIDGDGSLREPICSCSRAIRAQVVYSIKTEMAMTPEDIIDRRLMLNFHDCPSGRCRKTVREILQRILSA